MYSVYQNIDQKPEPFHTGVRSEIYTVRRDEDPANKEAVEYVFTHYNEVYQQYKFKERSLDRKIADKTLIERGIKFRYSGTYYYIDKDLGIWIKDGHEYHLVEVFDQDGNKMIAKTDTMYCNTFNVVGMIDTEYKHYN